MANEIIFTPTSFGDVSNKISLGNFTGNLSGFNGKVLCIDLENLPDALNPLNLPTNTIRVKFKSGYTPNMGDTQTLVDAANNVWDIYKQSNSWNALFNENSDNYLLEVLGANTTNVTNMESLFHYCTLLTSVALFDTSNVTDMTQMFYCCESLTSVPLFDTSKVTDMGSMFYLCNSLTNIPLFDTSKVTNMARMFYDCGNVQSGAFALYQQASSQTNPPTNHTYTFTNCGYNTQTGQAELAQIPNDWK